MNLAQRALCLVGPLGLVLAAGTSLASLAIGSPALDDTPRHVELEELGIEMTLPDLEDLERVEEGLIEEIRGAWTGTLEPSKVVILFRVLPRKKFGFQGPADVLELIEQNQQRRQQSFTMTGKETWSGEYGYAPFATFARAEVRRPGETSSAGTTYYLAGLLKENGYSLEVTCQPALTGEHEEKILDFLKKHVQYEGDVWDVKWTDEQAKARWERDAPEDHAGDFEVIRTPHYIILTNSSGGRLFAKKMEQCYRQIQKLYPFEEVEGNRLMPVFVFRTADEYYQFCMKVTGQSRAQAERSKGHAWRDYYATWYESPNDPTHLHEATHQIFANRLRLGGGGSWFQEGVAEYISTSKNELNVVARAVREREHVPLRQFFQIESMLHSAAANRKQGGSEASDNYTQAALVIEFVHRSRLGRKSFEDFIHAVGKVPRGNLPALERAIQQSLGVSLEEFEEEFVKYCARR